MSEFFENARTPQQREAINSAIADKPRDAFRGQSRSPNILPFHMLDMVSYYLLLLLSNFVCLYVVCFWDFRLQNAV